MNLRLMAVIGGSFAFTAAVAALVVWVLVSGENAASKGSEQFASALVGDGPAPKGTDEYVRGVRSRFGEISSARVIDTRNHRVGRGNNARTFHLSDVFLQTAKGPAVVELEFDGLGIISKDVSEVYELPPRDVPDHALSDDEFVALAKAYDRRGGYASADLGVTAPGCSRPRRGSSRRRCGRSRQRRRRPPRNVRRSACCAACRRPRATSRSSPPARVSCRRRW